MTAVEWLAEHLCNEMNFDYWKAVEKAKEMEKEQIEEAYNVGYYMSKENSIMNCEEYYEETFKTIRND
jgi:predicted secreted protein